MMFTLRAAFKFSWLPLCLAALPIQADELPKGFVWLADAAPTIAQDMAYATPANFTGKPVPGYEAGSCILAEPAAKALGLVQAELEAQNLTLIVRDCYRPVRAVKAMVAAMAKRGDTDATYFPHVAGNKLVAHGYLASRSGHSSGGSVDLTLGQMDNGQVVSLDMGTAFDFFDPASHTDAPGIPAKAKAHRATLVAVMRRHGFTNYSREWWHFRYVKEPFAGSHFNFPVVSAPLRPAEPKS